VLVLRLATCDLKSDLRSLQPHDLMTDDLRLRLGSGVWVWGDWVLVLVLVPLVLASGLWLVVPGPLVHPGLVTGSWQCHCWAAGCCCCCCCYVLATGDAMECWC
jgi:hypothetical protein